MIEIVNLTAVRTATPGRPETIDDIKTIDEGFCRAHGLRLCDLHDTFETSHLCGFMVGTTLYVCVPHDYATVAGGGQAATSWLIYARRPGSTRPVGFARTENLVEKLQVAIANADTRIQQQRRQTVHAVA